MSSLDFAIKKSGYTNINLKVVCLEAIFNRRDTVVHVVLPTGYGKFLIYEILLHPLLSKRNELRQPSSVKTVETPVVYRLNSLIDEGSWNYVLKLAEILYL